MYLTIVNLAPADIKKEGPAFDLAIARCRIFAGGTGGTEGTPERASEYLIAGELALDGRVRPRPPFARKSRTSASARWPSPPA